MNNGDLLIEITIERVVIDFNIKYEVRMSWFDNRNYGHRGDANTLYEKLIDMICGEDKVYVIGLDKNNNQCTFLKELLFNTPDETMKFIENKMEPCLISLRLTDIDFKYIIYEI